MKTFVMVVCVGVLAVSAACAAEVSGSVSVNGSTSMERVIGILSEQFMYEHPDVTVTYDATGSGTGIEAAAAGVCDIGLSSRALKAAETDKGLVSTVLALDCIAVIVNAACPVEDLTPQQIAAVFRGEIRDWAELGGSGPVSCIGREAGSGTRDGFESITGTTDKCVLAQELTSTGSVLTAVQNNAGAIGYVSAAAVAGQKGIKVLSVNGVPCTPDNGKKGLYVIQRPFLLVTRRNAQPSPAAEAFFAYITSGKAASLIANTGVVPLAE